MLLLKNRKIDAYVEEIQNLQEKLLNNKLKKSQIVLTALEVYFDYLIKMLKIQFSTKKVLETVIHKELIKDKEFLS
jgi:pantothenate kinase